MRERRRYDETSSCRTREDGRRSERSPSARARARARAAPRGKPCAAATERPWRRGGLFPFVPFRSVSLRVSVSFLRRVRTAWRTPPAVSLAASRPTDPAEERRQKTRKEQKTDARAPEELSERSLLKLCADVSRVARTARWFEAWGGGGVGGGHVHARAAMVSARRRSHPPSHCVLRRRRLRRGMQQAQADHRPPFVPLAVSPPWLPRRRRTHPPATRHPRSAQPVTGRWPHSLQRAVRSASRRHCHCTAAYRPPSGTAR